MSLKIKSIAIKNFRSFKDTVVDLDDYTAFVGPNGAGKSTVLCALNIFFRQTEEAPTNLIELDVEDFHNGDVKGPIEITLTFNDLEPEAQADFAEYYRSGLLIVSAVAEFNPTSRRATVRQFAKRSAMKEFSDFFRRFNDGAPAGELAGIYEEIQKSHPEFGLPKKGTKEANRQALRSYEEDHPESCVLIDSEDQFYGFSKGGDRLSRYVQWVYVPAVKDATKENVEGRNTALGKLLSRTVRSKVDFESEIAALRDATLGSYKKIIQQQQTALDDLSKTLTAKLGEWAHPQAVARLEWTEDPVKSVQIADPMARLFASEGNFSGDLARFGHGLQRSYLLALLQELANTADTAQPRLILGCEEPELYQHPPQARHLASVFKKLGQGNSQILVSTHSPHFVSGRHFEHVRLVRRDEAEKKSNIRWTTCEKVAQKLSDISGDKIAPIEAERAQLHQALQPHINEMFFTQKLVLVEGLEDTAYITAWMTYSNLWDDYRKSGCNIVAVNGKSSLIEPLIIAKELSIPTFVVFDADGNVQDAGRRNLHKLDNEKILKLLEGDISSPFPDSPVWTNTYAMWPENLGSILKQEVGAALWDSSYSAATKGLGNPSGSFVKNTIHIGDHLTILRGKGVKIPTLDRLCAAILALA
ncbi:ATP-dependent endonuclease [Bradyrhizobium diazoefficiens]|uniref:ATP-dependent endonuclease n=1 Tax=Bradyrhizobium diazoefficiens TaxID=1355477 RepID=A0A809YVH7_9BRAD|nr:ATP-dependent endonuclease [Bradyrhizobium diazoefficiens]BCA25126.1 ATP-dependent endonuclease [Bradyrhizobium diazoefficiens]BCE43275.1 ATP-dependent endonuclease [Bradyrhizobium diazoefficiens]BCE78200.1 ATP-dependent endonuclease [Bradyrhizobium diazoefficiens]BCE86823.1 ATP-dependent endonuclease [Bradyrhizobium diazoefficiens]